METTTPTSRIKCWSLAALLLLLGCALRIVPWTSFDGLAFDESLYRKYLLALDRHGLAAYPDLTAAYLEDGRAETTPAKAPPTRLLFVVAGLFWKQAAFGDAPPADLETAGGPRRDPALISLHRVSTLAGCLGLLGAWLFARRLLGEIEGLAALALCACSPLLIHTSQHALIDGLYGTCALFALWTLWESLQPRARPAWLFAFGGSFTLLVLAKEIAVFPALGFGALLVCARPLGLGQVDRRHWGALLTGGLLGVAILVFASGGISPAIEVYRLLVHKAQALPYAHETGGGPWSRYLIDLLILAPATLCFALGGGFRALREDRRGLGLVVFFVITYAAMCSVPNGMNLRYTTIWDFPLRALAALQAAALVARFARPQLALFLTIAALGALDLAQYRNFFVAHRLYELPTADLLRAENILK